MGDFGAETRELGANLGDAKSNLLEAAKLIREKLAGANILASHLYDTPPVGGPEGQQRFFNGVLSIDSPHSAMETWMLLREVEAQLGAIARSAGRPDASILICYLPLINGSGLRNSSCLIRGCACELSSWNPLAKWLRMRSIPYRVGRSSS